MSALHHRDFANHLPFGAAAESAKMNAFQLPASQAYASPEKKSSIAGSIKQDAHFDDERIVEWAPHKLNDKAEIIDRRDRYEVTLDVSRFKPGELAIRMEEGQLVVEGKHEELVEPRRRLTRQFVRKYSLPGDVNFDKVSSALSHGVLVIDAPKKSHDAERERIVPIKLDQSNY